METNNPNSDRMKIADRLKEARTLAGLSQSQAADRLGLQRPAISEIESGKRKVSAEEIIQFSNLYRVDASWLILNESETKDGLSPEMKFAAREFAKLSKEDANRLVQLMKILPK
ncbi:helix-turn-helix transcriptional regulator [Pedobacter sp.]|jgi:transcriptional regulator with XRE-family HTH domain|uniref:helix-turn-helix domain-containing protein n=1 Tax=Pedobacter sp. TaxID=1411316 RepID=UPI002C206C10|nr:helix-turn-helix transcriptional regulator [Pedobacter sp.]HWW37736.1 helix-turn-helix transcriptional regulator [Pedobacter sp.]